MHPHVPRNENSIGDRQRMPLIINDALRSRLEPRHPHNAGRYCDLPVPGRDRASPFAAQAAARLGVLQHVAAHTCAQIDRRDHRLIPYLIRPTAYFCLSPPRHSLVRWSGSPCTGRAQAGSLNRPMMPMSVARSRRFRPRWRVSSMPSRLSITSPSRRVTFC